MYILVILINHHYQMFCGIWTDSAKEIFATEIFEIYLDSVWNFDNFAMSYSNETRLRMCLGEEKVPHQYQNTNR
jgi:hypothetical protein